MFKTKPTVKSCLSPEGQLLHVGFQFISFNHSIVQLNLVITTKQWTTSERNFDDSLQFTFN